MSRVGVALFGGIALSMVLLLGSAAHAGPLGAEAEQRVNDAVALMPRDLAAAEAMLKSVEVDYPGETEAIAWARYRLSEIYWAGQRWSEGAVAAQGARAKAQEDPAIGGELRFLASYQLARFLDKLWVVAVLPQIVEEALTLYEGLGTPTPDQEAASGWLGFFKAKYRLGEGDFPGAREAARSAAEVAERVSSGPMLAWAKLFEARALISEGNLLSAEQVLNQCVSEYAGEVEADYAADAQIRLVEVQTRLGRLGQAHDGAISLFMTPGVDQGLQAEALVRFAEAAMGASATPEAVRALSLAKNALGGIPTWGDIAKAQWHRLVNRRNADARLQEAASGGSAPERAAVELELARREPVPADALARCDAADSICSDPRLQREIGLLRAERSGQDAWATADALLAQANGDRALIRRVLEPVRKRTWRKVGEESYPVWLDAHQSQLPRAVYLLEKAWWLRDAGADDKGSLTLLDEVLSGAPDTADRIEGLHGRVVSLYRLNRDEEAAAAVAELEREIADPSERKRALLIAADSIARQREEPALALFDRVIASGQDPVWLQEAYLIKARCLWNFHRGEEAVLVLSQLGSLPPLPSDGGRTVGEGLLLQASILYPHRDHPRWAEGVYERVIAASEELRAVQEEAYLQYVGMLEQWGADPNRIVELCERGLEALSRRAHPRTRGLLALSKAQAEYALGFRAEAIAAAEELLQENPNGEVQTLSRQFLKEVGQ